MVLTHQEALQQAAEARSRGDRAGNRKFSTVARDIQARVTAGDTSIDFYDTQTGQIKHSEAGSDTHIAYVSGESPRFVPVDRDQLRQIRAFKREQDAAFTQAQIPIPFQTVRSPDGYVLYTLSPGDTPGTALLTVPSAPGEPTTSKWTVTYDIGTGERVREFDTEQEATSFRDTLVTRETAKVESTREKQFTLVGEQVSNFLAYLKSVGPTEATPGQQSRIDAGLPLLGIPGPALTKPGSIEEKLEGFAVDVLFKTEAPFKAVTDPLRKVEGLLDKLSHDVFKTTVALQPPILLGAQTQPIMGFESVIRVPTDQKPVVGTAAYLASVGLGVLATGVDVATFEIRPGLQVEVAAGVAGLVLDPEVRKGTAEGILADPFRFVANLIGGAAVGQQIKIGLPKVESEIRQFLAKRSFDKLTVGDQTLFAQFEREINLDFPEEVVESTTTRTLFKRGELKVLNDADLIMKKIPFFIETSPEVEKLLVQAIPDEFSLERVNKQLESYYALPFDDKGGAILVRGQAGMKPFAEAMAPLPPRSEQVAAIISKTKTPSSFIPKTEQLFKATMDVESVFHFPAINIQATLATAAKATIPRLSSLIPSITISSLLSLPVSVEKVKDVTKSMVVSPQALKQILEPINIQEPGVIQVPKPVTFQIPKSIQVQIPTQTQIQKPFQFPVQIQQPIQVSIQTPIPIQIPKITIPTPGIVTKITPPPEPKPRIKVKRKKKKKKKKPTGKPKKGIFELRIDKIVKGLLKL